VATADHDKPAGAAEGARDDLPAGSAPPNASNGGAPDPADGVGAAGHAGGERAADNDASAGAGGAGAGAVGAGPSGSDAGPTPDPDDFEPYLPPGPNPFSSVHPQGPPPYRPLGSSDYPGEGSRGPWPGDPAPVGSDSGANGHDEQHPANGGGPGVNPAQAIPWAGGPSWPGSPAPSSPSGPSGPPATGEPRFERPEAGPADPFGRPRSAPDPGQPVPPEPGYPHASPYPPVPADEPGRSGPGSYGGVSPYPAYRPYGPDEQASDEALTDYGLPSPQSYGYAPPPPPVEPLPGLGVPEPGYQNEAPHEDYRPEGPQGGGFSGEPLPDDGYPGEAPHDNGYPGGGRDDESALPLAPERGRPTGGHRRGQGAPGHHRVGASDDADLLGGLRGPASAPSAPARGGPPGAAQPPRPLGRGPGSGPLGGGPLAGGPLAGGQLAGGPRGGAQPGMTSGGAGRPAPALDAGPGLRGDELPPLPPAGDGADEKETAASLTSEALLHGKRAAPGAGWRRSIFKATGGLVRVGESAAEQRRRELVWRVRTPVAGGHHRVAVMSLKGGVGKTTTTVGLGATLATLRGDRVIAVDANPDRGTLSDKVRLETSATVRDLLNERGQVHRYADVRAFTSQAPSRLEVLASDRDPAVSVAFSEADYFDVARVLEHYYSICITDCGTGLLHSAMAGVLRLADQIVLVSSPSVDGARSASATLDWLDAHDYSDLVRNAVVVLSTVRPRSKSTVDLDRLEQHFAARCRAVTRIPYDSHLEEGAEVELEQLSPATTEAYLRLAATVGDGFAWPRRATHRPASAHP
jgi:MinD-like ATPase involved in chromosome partitioning or flagellar assembly